MSASFVSRERVQEQWPCALPSSRCVVDMGGMGVVVAERTPIHGGNGTPIPEETSPCRLFSLGFLLPWHVHSILCTGFLSFRRVRVTLLPRQRSHQEWINERWQPKCHFMPNICIFSWCQMSSRCFLSEFSYLHTYWYFNGSWIRYRWTHVQNLGPFYDVLPHCRVVSRLL